MVAYPLVGGVSLGVVAVKANQPAKVNPRENLTLSVRCCSSSLSLRSGFRMVHEQYRSVVERGFVGDCYPYANLTLRNNSVGLYVPSPGDVDRTLFSFLRLPWR